MSKYATYEDFKSDLDLCAELQREIKRRCLIFQYGAKESLAIFLGVDIETFMGNLGYDGWSQIDHAYKTFIDTVWNLFDTTPQHEAFVGLKHDGSDKMKDLVAAYNDYNPNPYQEFKTFALGIAHNPQ